MWFVSLTVCYLESVDETWFVHLEFNRFEVNGTWVYYNSFKCGSSTEYLKPEQRPVLS